MRPCGSHFTAAQQLIQPDASIAFFDALTIKCKALPATGSYSNGNVQAIRNSPFTST